ncbi:hypothetical protein K438DRAFT_1767088 [Mycena galopus ATCC 62051]|nr:hypothetical protein K438DRAFT_1767088 [Mycena galopus ATCC 62051]
MLRYILHDWPDKTVRNILGYLRDAALPTTRLIAIEKIQPFASLEEGSGSIIEQIPGAARPTAEPPLLPNWGAATADLYLYDLTMHVMLGGIERTLDAFYDIFLQSGWKLVEVHHCSGSQLSHLIALQFSCGRILAQKNPRARFGVLIQSICVHFQDRL